MKNSLNVEKCYNSIVLQIKNNTMNAFKEAFQEFSNDPLNMSDSLETLIANYNKFTRKINEGLEPYLEKYKNAAKFQS